MGFDVGGIFKAIGKGLGKVQSWQAGFNEAQMGARPGSLAKDGLQISDPAAEKAGYQAGEKFDKAMQAIAQEENRETTGY